ncbi:MAG: hypothetical protein AAF573_22210 [Bacteroidota bacterium]
MKKSIILTILLFPIILSAQSSLGTTHDEYKYLSKGYAYQKQMGLDGDKAGYTVKSLFTASNGVIFEGLYANDNFRGAIVTIYPNSESPIFLGLPTNETTTDLQQLADQDIKEKLTIAAKDAYDKALLEFVIAQMGGGVNINNYVGQTEQNTSKRVVPENSIQEYNTVVPLKMERTETMTKRSGQTTSSSDLAVNNNVSATHDFADRNYINAPVVRGQHPANGTVVIKMCIDRAGNVKTAKFTQRGSSTFNAKLRKMALAAAQQVTFNEGLDAEQCGTIKFEFK